jgi:hypothetical protein
MTITYNAARENAALLNSAKLTSNLPEILPLCQIVAIEASSCYLMTVTH